MYGPVWSCMVPYGSVWPCKERIACTLYGERVQKFDDLMERKEAGIQNSSGKCYCHLC